MKSKCMPGFLAFMTLAVLPVMAEPVINEVLAHSHDIAPDWIELYNDSSTEVDLGGWFLSDDPDEPEKFRIADGTIIPANGYLVFYEDIHFGQQSTDPGALVPFALSENGDIVSIFGPGDGLRPDYSKKESFGASMTGVTKGRYFKQSTGTFNFVAMATPTPGAVNSDPRTGPVVISEIMYHPVNKEAEYLELVNISPEVISLFDDEVYEPWRMTKGVSHIFPSLDPITLQPGERLLLVRNSKVFSEEYTPPSGTRVIQWDSGALSNGGEMIQLSRPGDLDNLGERQYIRVDRVSYSDKDPWPTGPDGHGASLTRIDERAYGNDVANWTEASPTAGQNGYQKWAADAGLSPHENGPDDNPDGDPFSNLTEYAIGTNPEDPASSLEWEMAPLTDGIRVSFILPPDRDEVVYTAQSTTHLNSGEWINLDGSMVRGPGNKNVFHISDTGFTNQRFYRLVIFYPNQY